MPVFVGCDLGTLGTKAAVVDEQGAILGEAFEEVQLRYPRPGLVEQDLNDIEGSAQRTIAAALTAAGNVGRTDGVAFSGQMAGIAAVTADFTPATHYDSWLDTRCADEILSMGRHAARVVELSGCPPTYSHGPKILWWQRHRPDRFADIARFVVPSAYVAGRMTGLPGADAYVDDTHLHFSNLADTARGRWSAELVDLFGADAEKLPRVVAPTSVIGEVTSKAAAATGLTPGTPVAAGAGDTAAAALGAGVVHPGQAFDLAGTASVFGVCVDGFHPDTEHHTMMTMRSVVPGSFVALAFINGGGLALRWFRDEVAAAGGAVPAYADLDDRAEQVAAGADGLLWYPHVQGRVLPPEPNVRGAWIGLTSGHTTAHLYRALLEGVAYEYAAWARLVKESTGSPVTEARAVGGGARSGLWNRIKADVVNATWRPARRQECGVLGDALIAAAATGHVTDIGRTAQEWQSTGAPVRPDPANARVYAQGLDTYRLLAERLRPVFG
ncbi:xylulokinase [Nocardiopsis nanhaiensis]